METSFSKHRPVAIWLFVGVGMLIVQVLLGGITRLTGSGLSITEWQPILGALPPLNQYAWQQAFDHYKEIAQFKYVNSHFTLSDFKSIYYWEWFHREWGRLIGVVFLIPFVWFIYKKRIDRTMIKPLLILFLLGGLQGAIGWIMVQSGLNDEDLYVSHIRLAVHFISAMVLTCYTLWFALKLMVPVKEILAQPHLKKLNILLLAVLLVQLVYGAFMAGLHAALAASTWPDINGLMLPQGMFTQGGFIADITHNLITIQFIHRGLAYLLTFLILLWWWKARQMGAHTLLHKLHFIPLLLVLIQVLLGVLTVLNSKVHIPIGFAIVHQGVGMLLLLSLVSTYYVSRAKENRFGSM
ncbi:cytochrome c oxidase assembly protein subunit 15 [Chitinophaga costaii]|uniref:Cytochrome c oxidase assembly protein subunit 15 n=1 Tax=Chitinophaga costaii TaxID=1335309 RepID=A0A1C4AC86_9BACT|nr:COX15/CtaA family protein [Chitinophaga costaii]PUZ26867.1 heme A synthase [Chitinophaga costaii]SCB92209.1 cytochrome c oxidase assembly protein subunit 15 [Chitinophaga costaii]